MLLSLFFWNQTFAAQDAPVEKSNIACAESQGELQEKKKSQSGKPHGGELSLHNTSCRPKSGYCPLMELNNLGCERLCLIMELSHRKHARILAGAADRWRARACLRHSLTGSSAGVFLCAVLPCKETRCCEKIKPSHARVRRSRCGESSISLGSR